MFAFGYGAWVLLCIPILGALYYLRHNDRAKLWSVFQQKKRWEVAIHLSDSGVYFWRKVAVLFALLCLIIGLMRPQYGTRYQTVERQGRQVFFVVDTSLSMLAEDGAKTRLDLAKYHIEQLTSKLNDDFISIIPYASTAYTYLPLTTDRSAVSLFSKDMYVGMIGSSGSNIHYALEVVKDTLKASAMHKHATLIVFSDGEFTPPIEQPKVIELFKDMAIECIVVGIGSNQGEPIPIRDHENKKVGYKKDADGNIVLTKRIDHQLERLAEALNGIAIQGEASPLVAEKVYATLTKTEAETLASSQLMTHVDRYHWALCIALLLLMSDFLFPKLYGKYIKRMVLLAIIMGFPVQVFASHPGVDAYNKQEYEAAKDIFNNALVKRPDQGGVLYNLGNTYFKLKDNKSAAQAYTEALPKLSETEKIDAYYNLGSTQLANNNIKGAIKSYKEVLKRNPNHIQTKQNLELALRKQKMPPQQKENSEEGVSDKDKEDKKTGTQQKTDASEKNQSEKQQDSQKNKENQQSPDSKDKNNKLNNDVLSEQQINYLVDAAEKDARKKRQKKIQGLFEGDHW
jgi:Ca-activated chloride channel homolog